MQRTDCLSPSVKQTCEFLKSLMLFSPISLKLVLNAEKSKLMLLLNSKELLSTFPKNKPIQGAETAMVTSYKYLSIIIDQNLSFKAQFERIGSKLKFKNLNFGHKS